MWLINTTTLKLEEHVPSSVEYAILSHTWEAGEVTFQDMADLARASQKRGFSKILKTCETAWAAGIQWAWVDTCCIDKSSSAELTESINSMFRWYAEAYVCYALLSDLPPPGERDADGSGHGPPSAEELARCRWFTRGWTLQELLAPSHIVFFDRGWNDRGSKDCLMDALSVVTGIDADVLADAAALPEVPVARRMSWAARRQTTREEDRAYSLFGVFDVNLPLIYGEGGTKAFLRLQEAILQDSTDLSLFAWEPAIDDHHQAFRGLLAKSPDEFADGGHIRPVSDAALQQTEIRLSNRGLHFSPDVMLLSRGQLETIAMGKSDLGVSSPGEVPEVLSQPDRKTFVVRLNQYWVHDAAGPARIDLNNCRHVCLELFRTADGFVRRRRWVLKRNANSTRRELHIPRHLSARQSRGVILDADHTFRLSCESSCRRTFTAGFPGHLWHPETYTFSTKGQSGFVGMVSVMLEQCERTLTLGPGARRDVGEQQHTPKWHYPEFRVFFGIGKPGGIITAHASSSSSSSPSSPSPAAWVYVPPQADLLLGRNTSRGGYSQSAVDDPEGLQHLVRRSLDPGNYNYEPWEDAAGRKLAPNISDCQALSGPLLLRPEFEEKVSAEPLLKEWKQLLVKMSLDVSATVESRLFPDGMTEHHVRIRAQPSVDCFRVGPDRPWPAMKVESLSLV